VRILALALLHIPALDQGRRHGAKGEPVAALGLLGSRFHATASHGQGTPFNKELHMLQLVAWQTFPQANQLVDFDLAVQDSLVALPLLHNAVVAQVLWFE